MSKANQAAQVTQTLLAGVLDMLGVTGKADSARVLNNALSARGLQKPSVEGLIGTRDAIPSVARQAPVPDFGNPRGFDEIPEALRVALGEGAARTPNSAVADSLQDSAPDLANLIRSNDLNNAARYGAQGNLDFRNPAGAQNLVDTSTRSGRTTPAGTNIGGRMFTDASFASPRNLETTRLANMARQADLPDAPARMPDGQREMDFRSTREIMGSPSSMTAPRMPSPQLPAYVGGDGVMQNLSELVGNLSPGQRTALGLGGLAGAAFLIPTDPNNDGSVMTPSQEMSAVGAEGRDTAIVPPSVAPLSPPTQGELDPRIAQLSLTSEQNAALQNQQSNIIEALSQSDPAAADVARALAPRDPSYYTPERGGIEQYYNDRRNFVEAMDSGELKALVEEVKQTNTPRGNDDALSLWAEANPALAYELINRVKMSNPGQSLQSGQQATGESLGSSLGNNNASNAQSQGELAVDRIDVQEMPGSPLEKAAALQKISDLNSAAAPIQNRRLYTATQLAERSPAQAFLNQMLGN